MKQDITVGLFTYQRPKYLRRQLVLFKELGWSFRLLVLDGSESNEIARLNKSICKDFSVEHIRETSLQARHVILNEKLDADFVAYATDDDLIFPDFYSKGAVFLRENREYSVVAGRLPTLNYVRKYLWLGYYFRNHLSNMYDFHHGDFLERLLRRDQSYYLGCPPTFYGVRRSQVHQTLCKYVGDLKQYSSIERLESISNCIHGGMKVLDTVMGFRDYSSETTRNPQRDDPKQYICNEDIQILQDVIRQELKDSTRSDELLEYYASYAWLLPLRKIQCAGPMPESKPKLVIECLFNKYFSHVTNSFDLNVAQALRNAQRELFD